MADPATTRAIEELAAVIADQAYLEVARWHLYLGDAKLHLPLAEQLYPLVSAGTFTPSALAELLARTTVPIGGGQGAIPLAQLIPAPSQASLAEAIADYQREL
jgi:hypothetical protein